MSIKYKYQRQPGTLTAYYLTDFGYRNPFFFTAEGKIYSYKVMREALDFFKASEPQVFEKIRLLILGFDRIRNSRTGLSRTTLSRHLDLFRDLIGRYLKNQEWEPLDPECPNPEAYFERQSRIEKLKNKDVSRMKIEIYLINGQKMISLGHCLRVLGLGVIGEKQLNLKLGKSVPWETHEFKRGSKILSTKIFFLNREECQTLIDQYRYKDKVLAPYMTKALDQAFEREPIVKELAA